MHLQYAAHNLNYTVILSVNIVALREIHIQTRRKRVERQALAKQGNALLVPAEGNQPRAEPVVGVDVVGIELQRAPELLLGGGQIERPGYCQRSMRLRQPVVD